MAFFGLFGKEKKEDLNKGLEKTKEGFFSKLAKTIAGKSTVDDEVLDNLEDALVSSDVGVETTVKIIKNIEARVARDKYLSSSELERILREEVELIMKQASAPATADDYQLPAGSRPHVIMVVGVNGVGKTTTIGKMAHQFKAKGYQVMLGAADTFRAAAVDQLTIWSDRAGVEIVKQGQGADPAAVAFDAVQSAKARGADVCIIDTAGRLHNKVGLMNELSKIKRVMQKVVPDAPHEVLLVLDSSTGQNAIEQAKQFTAATEVTAIALTKLDGTAKGGVVIGIADQFKIPVKYIGVGEKMHQLQLFDSAEFIDSLFDKTGFKI
ncbi:MAG: signal recognition particle-docking protein FtsY [Bacteroidota bacterium]